MKHRVLVIDDDALLRRGMVRLISATGAEVLQAASVAEAIEQLAAQPTDVLLDLNLFDGHGTAVLRHIRQLGLPIRVAVVSGSSDTQLLGDMQSLRPDATFRKPPDWDALLRWVTTPAGG